MNSVFKKYKKFIPVIIVGVPVIVRTIIYLFVAFKGIGTLEIKNYISIIINLVMYISLLKYSIDYFVKGKNVSLNGLIFRFGISSLATLLSLQSENKVIFMLTAVMVFIVPYVSASLSPNGMNKKKVIITTGLVLVVLIVSIVLAVLYIKNPIENYLSYMGTTIYNLDAMNSAVQWTLFTILGVARAITIKNREK